MNGLYKLSDLKQGEKALVFQINSKNEIARRFRDIGLINGTEVSCVHKSPLGDPSAYSIRGALIAIRSEDADTVLVRTSEVSV